MRVVIQRVKSASVEVDGRVVSKIGPGLLCLVGLREGDGAKEAEFCVRRILGLRLWPSDAPAAGQAKEIPGPFSPAPASTSAPATPAPASTSAPATPAPPSAPAARPKPWAQSVVSLNYDVLCVSQFTLYARYSGTKPDFSKAMKSDEARAAYERFLAAMRQSYPGGRVEDGVFGAMMDVSLVNDGPVTITIDSANPGNAQEFAK